MSFNFKMRIFHELILIVQEMDFAVIFSWLFGCTDSCFILLPSFSLQPPPPLSLTVSSSFVSSFVKKNQDFRPEDDSSEKGVCYYISQPTWANPQDPPYRPHTHTLKKLKIQIQCTREGVIPSEPGFQPAECPLCNGAVPCAPQKRLYSTH